MSKWHKNIYYLHNNGANLQFASKKFLKKHPNILTDKYKTEKDFKKPKLLFPCGDALVKITGIRLKIVVKVLFKLLAEKGIPIGAITRTSLIAISKIPINVVANIISEAIPPNWP